MKYFAKLSNSTVEDMNVECFLKCHVYKLNLFISWDDVNEGGYDMEAI